MDQSSFATTTSNLPRMNRRALNTSTLASNTNLSHRNYFLTDKSDKLKSDWGLRGILDWTMEHFSKRDVYESRRDRLLREKFVGYAGAILCVIIVMFAYNYVQSFFNPTDTNIQLNLMNKNFQKLEDDLEMLKNRVDTSSDHKIEPANNLERLLKSSKLKDHMELFAIEKFDAIVSKLLNEKLKPLMDRELKSMIERVIKYELMGNINEQIVKKVDLVVDDKISEIKHASGSEISEIMIKNSLREEIRNLIQDGNALDDRPDYAAEMNNAQVIDASRTYRDPNTITILFIPIWSLSSSPNALLKRSSRLLDNYPWKMDTDRGFVKLRLGKSIVPVSFTYEHIIRSNIFEENQILCSPKVFRVFGYENEKSDESIPLGRFTFDIRERTEAEFAFDNVKHKIAVIQFNVETNHGNSNYTCMHRIKVF